MITITTLIGLTAATLTTICFVPQVYKTWKSKETKNLSLIMYLMLSTGILLWLVYGLFINDLPIIAANAVSLLLAISLLTLKIIYGQEPYVFRPFLLGYSPTYCLKNCFSQKAIFQNNIYSPVSIKNESFIYDLIYGIVY